MTLRLKTMSHAAQRGSRSENHCDVFSKIAHRANVLEVRHYMRDAPKTTRRDSAELPSEACQLGLQGVMAPT